MLHSVKFLLGNSRDDGAYLRTYIPVLSENRPTHVTMPFRNAVECWNADGRINSGNDLI